jgi:hypothetical protein
VAALAIRLGVAPSVLWAEDPRDLATVLDVLAEVEGAATEEAAADG